MVLDATVAVNQKNVFIIAHLMVSGISNVQHVEIGVSTEKECGVNTALVRKMIITDTTEAEMDKTVTEMMEYICDELCRFPRELDEVELDEKCDECRMGEFCCNILNKYNKQEEQSDLQRQTKARHRT